MLFNRRQFCTLSDMLIYISDYLEEENYVAVYIDVVRQASNIFDLGVVFVLSLIYAIKKNKSFAVELSTKENVKQLLLPLDCHMNAIRFGRT